MEVRTSFWLAVQVTWRNCFLPGGQTTASQGSDRIHGVKVYGILTEGVKGKHMYTLLMVSFFMLFLSSILLSHFYPEMSFLSLVMFPSS